MTRCLSHLIVAAALIGIVTASAEAQDYSFSVPSLQMHVVVNADASVRIVYDITFRNNPIAHAIDIVDIGVPHEGYSLSNVKASVEGERLGDVRHSEFVHPGFEVHLGRRTIRPGATGSVHVEFTMPDMVYQDTTRKDYASLRITPTWFGEQYVTGNTQIQVAIHLPKSVQPDEALHQGTNFTAKTVTEEGTSVVWEWPADRLTGPHMVAVSFPKRDLNRVVHMTKLGLLLKWFRESTGARVFAGIIFFVLFAILFFRFTHTTGCTVFVVLSALAVWLFYVSPGLHLLSLPIVAILIGLNEWALRHRKLKYMPPIAEVEGGGIKRGLTAPEAAVLLELPLSRILGLVIFGMLKKGMLRQVSDDPLTVEVDDAFELPEELQREPKRKQTKFYRKAGEQKDVVVHKYEQGFLFLLQNNPGKPVRDVNFTVPIKVLIERAAARMKGFDLSDTQDYYRAIVRRAVRQAAAVGDIQQREKVIDRNFEWILMDDEYPTVFTHHYLYRPIWARGPVTGGTSAPGAPSGVPSVGGKTSFGDVSASFAGWAENTMGSMTSAISPGALSVEKAGGGFLDLSGVDRVTGEFFKALGESGGGGGGGGGGFGGCACAGCACACACAGGGR